MFKKILEAIGLVKLMRHFKKKRSDPPIPPPEKV